MCDVLEGLVVEGSVEEGLVADGLKGFAKNVSFLRLLAEAFRFAVRTGSSFGSLAVLPPSSKSIIIICCEPSRLYTWVVTPA